MVRGGTGRKSKFGVSRAVWFSIAEKGLVSHVNRGKKAHACSWPARRPRGRSAAGTPRGQTALPRGNTLVLGASASTAAPGGTPSPPRCRLVWTWRPPSVRDLAEAVSSAHLSVVQNAAEIRTFNLTCHLI